MEQKEQLEKFRDLIEDVRVCMMITKSADGELAARPMSTSKVEEDGSIWFFTNEYSGKVEEINREHEVFLSYASPAKNTYLSFPGKATISNDRAKMEELWNPTMKAWFPEGLEDPKIALINVHPGDAEYWESNSSKVVFAFNVLKSLVTGKQYDEGEHGKLSV
ncbi:MAG: pyridoxamine 5-phosphate oxidase-related FMN-binding protein [Ferruginibacter sp.]|nr:pyridoxamine 5-phosphate oxidase-related FMN-binding protein [Ferruginibacter sp.]